MSAGDRDGDDLGRVYRATRREAPPAVLDTAIRQAAHAAAARRPGRFAGWRRAVPVAAVIVFSVALVQLVPREQQRAQAPETGAQSLPVPAGVGSVQSPASGSSPSAAGRVAEEADLRSPRKREAPAAPAALRTPLPSTQDDGAAPLPEAAPVAGGDDQGGAAGRASATTLPSRADQPATRFESRGNAEREADAPLEVPSHRATPEAWVAHIEQLLDAGQLTEAEAELDAFRRRYPQHPYDPRR